MSRAIQEKLANPALVGEGLRLAVDPAFPVGGAVAGKIVILIKEGGLDRVPPECGFGMSALSEATTSLCHAAGCGVGSAPKVYRQLVKVLPFQPSLRQRCLENIFFCII